jgi:hypothetical protein
MVTTRTTTYITDLKDIINTCFTANSITVGALTTPQTITIYQNVVDDVQSLAGLYKLTGIYNANTDFADCSSDFVTFLSTVGGLTPTIEDLVG